jgi:hypothetical protein
VQDVRTRLTFRVAEGWNRLETEPKPSKYIVTSILTEGLGENDAQKSYLYHFITAKAETGQAGRVSRLEGLLGAEGHRSIDRLTGQQSRRSALPLLILID